MKGLSPKKGASKAAPSKSRPHPTSKAKRDDDNAFDDSAYDGWDFENRLTYTDDDVAKKPSLLLVGPSGVGKTHVAGTFPNPFFINTDRGTLTVADKHWPKIDVRPGDSVYSLTMNLVMAMADGVKPFNKLDVETVVFDDLSRFCTLMEMEIIADPPDGKDREEVLWISDYNLIKNRLIGLLNRFRDLDMYVVGISGLVFEKDDQTGELQEFCDMTGRKIGPILPHYFDIVMPLQRDKEGNFIGKTRPTRNFKGAKFRRPGGFEAASVPEEIENPTFKSIMGLMK